MRLAPILLFVYNRPLHTKRTVEALKMNYLAKESELHIYSDAPKDSSVVDEVNETRKYLKSIDGFKTIKVIKREENWGLAQSIIDGVTSTIKEYERVIVLEDDLVTSPGFLNFMNEALDFYEKDSSVWHISGWNYPIDNADLDDTFFWRVMNCWGWATWSNRWSYFEKNITKTLLNFTAKEKRKFNLDGVHNFWNQIIDNNKGEISTWAVFWYATIFKHDGLCLNPSQSFVENIGIDGSGIHCNSNDIYKSILSTRTITKFQKNGVENSKAVKRIKKFYKDQKASRTKRIFRKITNILIDE